MRVVFLGNAPWSVPSLEAVAASTHQLTLVATRAPRPAGRGNRLTPTAVADAARRLGLPLVEVETVKSGPGFEALVQREPDVLAVVAYGEILPPAVLEVPRAAPVNVHFSLLPELRGAAPVQRAILEGLAVTGVTTIRMDEGMDTGRILLQTEEAIDPDDDAETLGSRLAALGARLLVDTIDRLQAGDLAEREQDEARATFAPKLKREDRFIDWAAPADAVVRRVRAMAPDPGATTTFRGKTLKILRARTLAGDVPTPQGAAGAGAGQEGIVYWVTKDGLAVAAADGAVRLEELAPEGRTRMTGAEFVRGFRPQPGERMG